MVKNTPIDAAMEVKGRGTAEFPGGGQKRSRGHPMSYPSQRSAYSLRDLTVVVAAVALLLSLLIPGTLWNREAARKRICEAQLQRLSEALLSYEYSYKWLPGMSVGQSSPQPRSGGGAEVPTGRWSGIIGLLPYLDEHALHASIVSGYEARSRSGQLRYGPFGAKVRGSDSIAPVIGPWSIAYRPNRKEIHWLRCPADANRMDRTSPWSVARTNYAFNMGDGQIGQNCDDPDRLTVRGPFSRGRQRRLQEMTDGTSNAIMFGEIATPAGPMPDLRPNLGQLRRNARVQGRQYYHLNDQAPLKGIDIVSCKRTAFRGIYRAPMVGDPVRVWNHAGTRWLDSLVCFTGFATILGPNHASCTPTRDAWGQADGIYTAGSYHLGGAHISYLDGAVRFIPNEVDTANRMGNATKADYYSPGIEKIDGVWQCTPNWSQQSPFGTWGEKGTCDAGDTIGTDLPN